MFVETNANSIQYRMILLLVHASVLLGTWTWTWACSMGTGAERREKHVNRHQHASKCKCKDVYINLCLYSPRYIIIILGKINQHTHTCNNIVYTYTSRHQHTVLYTYCISGFFHSKTSPTGPTEQTPKKTWVSNNSSNFGVLQDSVPFNFWWSHTYRASQVTGNPAPASPRATSGSQVHFLMLIHHWFVVDIVDGSEIRRSLVDMVNWNIPLYTDYICGFYIYPRWCRIFFHQQYVSYFLNWPGITRRRGVAFIFDHADGQEDVTRYRCL